MSFHEPQWYDRNAESKANHFDSGMVAPHGATKRLTYKVPPERQAMVELLFAVMTRESVATAAEIASAYWVLKTKKDTSGKIIAIARLSYKNTAGDSDKSGLGTTLTLHEGDSIEGYTVDLSNGGALDLFMGYKLTEFDKFEWADLPITRPTPEKPDIQAPKKPFDWWPF